MTDAVPPQQPGDCVFCSIVVGKVPARVVYEDELALAFLDIAPAAGGHTLVAPKNHADDLLSVSSADLVAVSHATQTVARLLDERINPDGFTVFQANRSAGWQDVFHLHFHVVPRWVNDPLRRPWRSQPAPQEDLDEVAARLGLTSA